MLSPQVSEDGLKIRRAPARPMLSHTKDLAEDLKKRTVYAVRIINFQKYKIFVCFSHVYSSQHCLLRLSLILLVTKLPFYFTCHYVPFFMQVIYFKYYFVPREPLMGPFIIVMFEFFHAVRFIQFKIHFNEFFLFDFRKPSRLKALWMTW